MAEGFSGDKAFSEFFLRLSGEEALHAKILEGAAEYLIKHADPVSSVSVDAETREKIEAPFVKSRGLLEAGILDRKHLMDCLASTEFSEWNDIFVYLVKSFGDEKEFMPAAARMHEHLREVRQFMESVPEGRKYSYIIKSLPRVWKENILVVDDDRPIAEFLARLLEHEGNVEIAEDGREGLRMVNEKYFDVIIADVLMPMMGGIEFYEQAVISDPDIRRRIIFFSGTSFREHADFFRKYNLKYLSKPAPIREILRKVHEVLHKT